MIAIPEIHYNCFLCDEKRTHIDGAEPIYKIIVEQCGKTELCICPDCIKNIRNLIKCVKNLKAVE